jgi:transposase
MIECTEVIHSSHRRRRWTAIEKQKMIEETYQPGATVSYVARKYNLSPSQLFQWRKYYENGALVSIKAEDSVVPQSEVNDLMKRIKKLEQVLGQKTLENEILREAIQIGREKKLISRQPLRGVENFE